MNTSEPTATVDTRSSRAKTESKNKKSGGPNLYELVNAVSECPKCFQKNSVHRDTDQYGIYDSCRTCGWLDSIGFHSWWTNAQPRMWKPSTPS